MLATEQHIVKPVETVASCDMLSNGKHIDKDSKKENDVEVSEPRSLAKVDGIYDAEKPIEPQNTSTMNKAQTIFKQQLNNFKSILE